MDSHEPKTCDLCKKPATQLLRGIIQSYSLVVKTDCGVAVENKVYLCGFHYNKFLLNMKGQGIVKTIVKAKRSK